jgi:glycine cleavage system H protein
VVRTDCLYTNQHEWVRIEGDLAVVGITDYAQQALGDVTYVELPQLGRDVRQMQEFAVIESVKAASDIYAPLSGRVAQVNEALTDAPETVNQDPYGSGWICKLADFGRDGLAHLLSPQQYEALVRELP